MLDLGVVAAGDTAQGAVAAHDFGWGALQALLDVHAFTLTGSSRFTLDGGFTPQTAGAAPALFPVAFDAAGATAGPYTATLTLHTRDQQDLSGAIDRADLVWDLSATVSGVVDVAVGPSGPERAGFLSIAPNPFRPATQIRFGMLRPGRADLSVYSVSGRLVRTLTRGTRDAGTHAEAWDGRDDSGRDLAPGIYFARLVTDEVTETRKLVKIR
jgi:hypothetical protein